MVSMLPLLCTIVDEYAVRILALYLKQYNPGFKSDFGDSLSVKMGFQHHNNDVGST